LISNSYYLSLGQVLTDSPFQSRSDFPTVSFTGPFTISL
jgi:hypothetical protein